MTEGSLLFSGDVSDSKIPTPGDARTSNPLWTSSDNSFRFGFFTDSAPPPEEGTPPADAPQPPFSFTGPGSAFAFNFQIPADPPAEDMDATEPNGRQREEEEEPSQSQSQQSKKKKKKSAKKTASDTETQQEPTEGSRKEEELSPEEQLNRQLDWCIEQLELGIRSQKGTPKQKEEASRALKTLRSSKAPLVKKRQVMRAMTGDYRKKMEEEKKKQFRLIQSETASAQVQAVSGSPKKSVFHRRAEVRTPSAASEEQPQQSEPRGAATPIRGAATPIRGAATPILQAPQEAAAFVFVPSKEEFHFNFL